MEHGQACCQFYLESHILGPLLFLIYINDLPQVVRHSLALLFADDTKCMKRINSMQDQAALQDDINAISNWASERNLSFNESKFIHLRICSSSRVLQTSYSIGGNPISTGSNHRDLGITMSSDLGWSNHIDSICRRAYTSLGLLKWHICTTSIAAKKLLYTSLIRAQLTFCFQIWRPQLIKDIIRVELVQRRVTKFIVSESGLSYKDRLVSLNMLPLMMVYEIYDITFALKSLTSANTSFNISEYICFAEGNSRSASHNKLPSARSHSALVATFTSDGCLDSGTPCLQ